MRASRHGPIIGDLLGPNEPPLAIEMANLAPGDTAATGLLELNRATSVAEAGQAAAAITQPDRTAALAHLRIPTVVLHGSADRVVSPSGGEATARAIPGARLVVIPGLGHEVPPGVQPQIVAEVTANARRRPA